MTKRLCTEVLGIYVFSMGVLASFAQDSAKQSTFDVALIQPSHDPSGSHGSLVYPGGRIKFGHQTIALLIEKAFEVQDFQVAGGEGWVRTEEYDIDARPPASSETTKLRAPAGGVIVSATLNDEQRQMLQALLANRFQLKIHRETRKGSVYFLEKGKGAFKPEPHHDQTKPWVGSPGKGMIIGDGVAANNATMPFLATQLSGYLQRPVIDQTGIAGAFDFSYRYDSFEGNPHMDVAPSILTSIDAVGLKLRSGKGPVQTIVIDHAEKPLPN